MSGRLSAWRRYFAQGGGLGSGARLLVRLARSDDPVTDALFERAGIGMAVVDPRGTIVRMNGTLRAMGPSAQVGAPIAQLFCPTCHDGIAALIHSAAREGARQSLLAITPGADRQQSIEIRPTPVLDSGGTCIGLVLHLLDLTAQTQLRSRLAHGERLQALGELTGGIAHDFNNLLTAILGAADEAASRAGHDAVLQDDVRQIQDSAGRGAALVAKLLAFGRQQTLQPGVLRINDAVRDIAGVLKRVLGQRIELRLDLEEPGRFVRVDPVQLDQVLLNLAVNARDAMPRGGTLTLRTGHLTLIEPLLRGAERIEPGRFVTIDVQDTGTGIPADVLPRIFDPYFTTKRESGGSGLGLASVDGVVRQSLGFMLVQSSPGEGALFRVHLPRHADPPAPAARPLPPASTAPAIPSGILLLVDDEEPVRRLAARGLANRGYNVVAADSAEAALEIVAGAGGANALSVVVSDVVMPGLDGIGLVRALRLQRPDLPAVLASGYADEASRRAIEVEGIAFLPKPYTQKGLNATIQDILSAGSY